MRDFLVNETRFLINVDEDLDDAYLSEGTVLPGGFIAGEQLDREDVFQLYLTQDGKHELLLVHNELQQRWVEDGFVPGSAFIDLPPEVLSDTAPQGQQICMLVHPASLIMNRITALKAHGSTRYALSVAAALQQSRLISPEVNLRDGIFCELCGCVLPLYSDIPFVCDHALFLNVISKGESQNLSGREMASPNLVPSVIRHDLKAAGYSVPEGSPFFEPGEPLEDITGFDSKITAGGLLYAGANYQLFDIMHSENMLLVLDDAWAAQLCEAGLLYDYDLLNIRTYSRMLRAMIVSKRQACESLNDRNFGLDLQGALQLALAMQKAEDAFTDADLTDALYVADKQVVLPQKLSAGSAEGNCSLYAAIVSSGPFACAPFTEEELTVLSRVM